MWDTYSGDCLQTFPHKHIVRSVAINLQGTQILTAGHEKKIRLFDLGKPEEDASLLKDSSTDTAHDGVIKSIVWQRGDGEYTAISAGEDKIVKWVHILRMISRD